MAKTEAKKTEKPEADAPEGEAATPKAKGLFKGLFANKKKLMIFAAAGLLVFGGAGTAAYLFLFSGGDETHPAEAVAESASGGHGAPAASGGHGEPAAASGHSDSGGHGGSGEHGGVPGAPIFFDLPAILVNLRSDEKPIFLKLVVSLELKDEQTLKGVEALLPRVVDQFQTYLRELRVDELSGSAATFRLKEELLRRVKIAASPMEIQDVLFKDMIIQ